MSGRTALQGVRVLLAEWTMALVRPARVIPANQAQFRVHPSMNKLEIRDYLKSVYGVQVAKVETSNQLGKLKRTKHRGVFIKRPDYKIAYITLAGEETFEFPPLFKALKDEQDAKEKAEAAAEAK